MLNSITGGNSKILKALESALAFSKKWFEGLLRPEGFFAAGHPQTHCKHTDPQEDRDAI